MALAFLVSDDAHVTDQRITVNGGGFQASAAAVGRGAWDP